MDTTALSRSHRPARFAALAFAVLLAACAGNGSSAAGAGSPAAGEAPPEDEAPDDAPSPEAGDMIRDVEGHVVHVRADWYALQPDDAPGARYAPDALPEAFREDGLAVVFSGRVGEIPPDVRMWGTPLELTDIRRRDDG